jgi:hypothetical protein
MRFMIASLHRQRGVHKETRLVETQAAAEESRLKSRSR